MKHLVLLFFNPFNGVQSGPVQGLFVQFWSGFRQLFNNQTTVFGIQKEKCLNSNQFNFIQ